MAKVDEAIEELTDEVSAVNTKYEGLAKDVSDIKKSMAQMAEAANKPIPPPTVSQSVVSQVVSVALGEYFRLHPVGTTFTDEDKENLVNLFYMPDSIRQARTMTKCKMSGMKTGARNVWKSAEFKALQLRNR
mgnify:CR=1 FL=1